MAALLLLAGGVLGLSTLRIKDSPGTPTEDLVAMEISIAAEAKLPDLVQARCDMLRRLPREELLSAPANRFYVSALPAPLPHLAGPAPRGRLRLLRVIQI